MYTGLFTQYVPIDIEKIAKVGRYAPEVVKEKLKQLTRTHIVKYVPAITSPMLNINNERLYDKNLKLPQSEYDERLSRSRDRLEAMISIVEDESTCRSKALVGYFGEENGCECGKCDVCLAKKSGRAKKKEEVADERKRSQYDFLVNLNPKKQ